MRSRHAAFEGQIFSWDTAPKGGYHPGEDYNCRCWAEPYLPEAYIKEFTKQTPTHIPVDAVNVWTLFDYYHHYFHEKGKTVSLHEIGILGQIIDKASRTIYPKMERLIFEKVQRERERSYPFKWNVSYSFHFSEFVIGGATITLNADLNVKNLGYHYKVEGDLTYDFYDRFTEPFDLFNNIDGDYNPPEAYHLTSLTNGART